MRLQALSNSKYNDAVWVQFSDALADGAPDHGRIVEACADTILEAVERRAELVEARIGQGQQVADELATLRAGRSALASLTLLGALDPSPNARTFTTTTSASSYPPLS